MDLQSVVLIVLLVAQAVFLLAVIAIGADFLIVHFSKQMRSPFLRTPRAYFETIFDALELEAGDVLYDLGCGDGSLLLECAIRNPNVRCIGIERNPLLCAYARARAHVRGNPKNLTFARGNLFEKDLNDATHLYTYLVPSSMELLSQKLARENIRVRLASRAFPLRDWAPTSVRELSRTEGAHGQHQLFVYDL